MFARQGVAPMNLRASVSLCEMWIHFAVISPLLKGGGGGADGGLFYPAYDANVFLPNRKTITNEKAHNDSFTQFTSIHF